MHGLVDHRGELPRPVRAERDLLDRVRAVAVAGEHLRARVDDLDRAPELAGRHRRQGGVVVRPQRRSEGPADERRDDVDVLLGDAEPRSQVLADVVDLLRLVEDRELVPLPDGDRPVRLHRIVVLDGNAVLGLDLHRRALHRLLGVAAALRRRPLPWRARAFAHGLRVGHVLLRVVGDFHQARGVARLLVGLGDDERYRLPIEKDSVGLERPERLVLLFPGAPRRRFLRRARSELRRVQVREDADHAGRGFGLPRVDRLDRALRHGAQHDEAVREVRHLELGRVLGLARHLRHAVDAAHLFSYVSRHR